jgi:hypothetical protein
LNTLGLLGRRYHELHHGKRQYTHSRPDHLSLLRAAVGTELVGWGLCTPSLNALAVAKAPQVSPLPGGSFCYVAAPARAARITVNHASNANTDCTFGGLPPHVGDNNSPRDETSRPAHDRKRPVPWFRYRAHMPFNADAYRDLHGADVVVANGRRSSAPMKREGIRAPMRCRARKPARCAAASRSQRARRRAAVGGGVCKEKPALCWQRGQVQQCII